VSRKIHALAAFTPAKGNRLHSEKDAEVSFTAGVVAGGFEE
jgi:hypothetical protein